jgi:hypothetical protein
MKSDKSKSKVNQDKFSELVKSKKKLDPVKKDKVSIKSSKFWEEIDEDDDITKYKIKGM